MISNYENEITIEEEPFLNLIECSKHLLDIQKNKDNKNIDEKIAEEQLVEALEYFRGYS